MNDLISKAATIKAQAEKIDTSRTETVKMSDLRVGDVVLAVGPDAKAFPFPFTLSKVQHLAGYRVVMLQATHGWFNMRPYPQNDPAVIVAR
jgi:hypothetical protein